MRRWEVEAPQHEEGWAPFEMPDCAKLNNNKAPAGISSVAEPPEDAPELCVSPLHK